MRYAHRSGRIVTTQITSHGGGEVPAINADGHFVAFESSFNSPRPGDQVAVYLFAAP